MSQPQDGMEQQAEDAWQKPLISACRQAYGWPQELADRVMKAYLLFMKLKLRLEDWEGEILEAPPLVESMWQRHVLAGPVYEQDCRRLCHGKLVKYDAYFERTSLVQERIAFTNVALKTIQEKSLDTDIWTYDEAITPKVFLKEEEKPSPITSSSSSALGDRASTVSRRREEEHPKQPEQAEVVHKEMKTAVASSRDFVESSSNCGRKAQASQNVDSRKCAQKETTRPREALQVDSQTEEKVTVSSEKETTRRREGPTTQPAVQRKEATVKPVMQRKEAASKPIIQRKETSGKPVVQRKEAAAKPVMQRKEVTVGNAAVRKTALARSGARPTRKSTVVIHQRQRKEVSSRKGGTGPLGLRPKSTGLQMSASSARGRPAKRPTEDEWKSNVTSTLQRVHHHTHQQRKDASSKKDGAGTGSSTSKSKSFGEKPRVTSDRAMSQKTSVLESRPSGDEEERDVNSSPRFARRTIARLENKSPVRSRASDAKRDDASADGVLGNAGKTNSPQQVRARLIQTIVRERQELSSVRPDRTMENGQRHAMQQRKETSRVTFGESDTGPSSNGVTNSSGYKTTVRESGTERDSMLDGNHAEQFDDENKKSRPQHESGDMGQENSPTQRRVDTESSPKPGKEHSKLKRKVGRPRKSDDSGTPPERTRQNGQSPTLISPNTQGRVAKPLKSILRNKGAQRKSDQNVSLSTMERMSRHQSPKRCFLRYAHDIEHDNVGILFPVLIEKNLGNGNFLVRFQDSTPAEEESDTVAVEQDELFNPTAKLEAEYLEQAQTGKKRKRKEDMSPSKRQDLDGARTARKSTGDKAPLKQQR